VSKTVIIIGGGIGGLATANLLQKAGYTVHVYEKNAQLGGRAGSRTINGFRYDTGPSWYLMPEVFSRYFAQFGRHVNDELGINKLTPAYKVFFESHDPITIHGNLKKDAQQFELLEPGAGEALTRYVEEGDEIYQLALRYFLYTDFSQLHTLLKKEVIFKSTKLISLLTQPLHTRVQKFVKTKALQQILEYPMVFLGTSPFKAPSMYSLMSALDFREGVYYPKKGMYSIIELLVTLGKELGVQHHTKSAVKQITVKNGKSSGVVFENGDTMAADIIISNADLHFTETSLLTPTARSYPEAFWEKKEAGISALLLYIGVKGKLPQLEHHNLYFIDNWKENFNDIYAKKNIPNEASLYVSRTTATDPTTAPKGHENLFMLVPLPTGVALSKKQQDALAARCLDTFATAIGEPNLRDKIVSQEQFGPADFKDTFHAWKGTALGMSHELSQSALWRIPPKSKKVSNLYYVGANTMPGIGLPMCLISAEVVTKKILKEHRS
jgi:phytoene desaturase